MNTRNPYGRFFFVTNFAKHAALRSLPFTVKIDHFKIILQNFLINGRRRILGIIPDVLSGLSLVTSPDVIIHEAARPFVKVEDFEEIINCPERNATFGLDIPFTVLRGQDHVEGVLTRSELFNVQLPQKFETSVLKEAHDKALADGMTFTEDASLVFHYFPGTIIHICQGRDYNVKLTTRIDMLAGEIIYDEVFRRRR